MTREPPCSTLPQVLVSSPPQPRTLPSSLSLALVCPRKISNHLQSIHNEQNLMPTAEEALRLVRAYLLAFFPSSDRLLAAPAWGLPGGRSPARLPASRKGQLSQHWQHLSTPPQRLDGSLLGCSTKSSFRLSTTVGPKAPWQLAGSCHALRGQVELGNSLKPMLTRSPSAALFSTHAELLSVGAGAFLC